MALVRLARVEDYEAFDLLGRTMYRVTWCDKLCPGNPTEDPISGIELFNEWQCALAAGHEQIVNPATRLSLIVSWCLATRSRTSAKVASEIIGKYKCQDYLISLAFDASEFEEPGLAYRYELAFLNDQVVKLPALQILQLQTLKQEAKHE